MNMKIEIKVKEQLCSIRLILYFIMFIIAFIFVVKYSFSQEVPGLTTRNVCIKDICVEAELAVSRENLEKGLMFRDGLPEGKGMLFIFAKEGRYSFWTKNMRFPLDMIWIDSHKKIVAISQEVAPCVDSCEGIAPQVKSRYVLEVNSGFAKRNNIKIGDLVEF